jgi:DnaJ-class molecular chaperone
MESITGCEKHIVLKHTHYCQKCQAAQNKGSILDRIYRKKLKCQKLGKAQLQQKYVLHVPEAAKSGDIIKLESPIKSHCRYIGDVYIRLHVLPHCLFNRDGFNIYTTKIIPYSLVFK